MSIHRVVPNLPVPDLESARAFWVEGMGFEVAMDLGWIATFVAPGAPTTQVSALTHDATAPVIADISVEVADVDAVHAALAARGYEVVYPLTDEPWGVRRFFVREPGGRVVNIVAHRAEP
jgi:catechol 2,3-dioxygenase-like lactoylglutathione lyase family enzyme